MKPSEQKEIKRISIIGAGNVAQAFMSCFGKTAHIVEVFVRNKDKARQIEAEFGLKTCSLIQELDTTIDGFLICVPDQAIAEVSAQLPKAVPHIHCSGNTSMEVLSSELKAVLYPLQTFSEGRKVEFKTTPVLIESNSKSFECALINFARTFSDFVEKATSEKRQQVHLAAVFACNFTNYMHDIAEQILEKNDLPKQLLSALIDESFEKLKTQSAKQAQTGPAERGDHNTIEGHLELLKNQASWQELYQHISQDIMKRHGKL
ncbi:MAG: Rossmann-like and DUF2520 domain-containing protein [Flavobacteriales bacterium]